MVIMMMARSDWPSKGRIAPRSMTMPMIAATAMAAGKAAQIGR